jgi:4-amino-4-deoxy-L-arabinose transferase-like glycosyltransferase
MKQKKILLTILIIAAVLRFWNLGKNPPSLYWDEASLGYNAYSILKTGRDEHSELLPVTRFIAFGDYKPSGYIYATVPFIWLFGLNEFSIRFASAFAGTLTVLITYFLVKELFKDEKWKIKPQIIAAGLLAINPWHLQFSRGAFEANLATFFSATGILFFIKGLRQGKFFSLSALFFILSMYTFNTHRAFIPLMILAMLIFFKKSLIKQKRDVALALFISIILLIPLIPFLLSREGQLRFQEVTIFRNLNPINTSIERIEREGNSVISRIIHNRRIQYAIEFMVHYADHFKVDFLFFSGDVNPRLGTRDHGLFYPIELPFMLLGIYWLVKKKKSTSLLLFSWILLGIIPAGTARETPHALRTLNILPAPQIIIAVGIVASYQLIKNKKIYFSIFVTSYFLLLTSYLHTYHNHYPKHWAHSWQYGYKQMVEKVNELQDNYDRIYITRTYGRPYIFMLLYLNYPPNQFWESRDASRDWFGFWTVKGFDKYRFGDFDPIDTRGEEKWLLVAGPMGLPGEARQMEQISFPNGEVAFDIGEIR